MRIADLQELFNTLRDVDYSRSLADVLLPTTRKLFRAQHAVLWLPATGRYPESLLSSRAHLSGLVDVTPIPKGFRGFVLQTEQVVTLGGLSDARLHAEFEEVGIRDAIGVALRSGSSPIGTLEIAGRADHLPYFDTDDISALNIIGSHVSAAVENTRLMDRLRFDAYHDTLTGLPNRRQLVAALEEAVKVQAGEVVAVIELDVSGLGYVNDSLGYSAGNTLLAEVAKRLRAASPPAALVARVGGDEFVVLIRMLDADVTATFAAGLRKALQDNYSVGSLTLNVDVRVGIAVHPDHGSEPETLLQRADVATHAAKSTSTAVQMFNLGLASRSTRWLGLAGDLRRALEDGAIEVYFQPKVALRSRHLVGVECLVRWDHPTHGPVPPQDIAAVAEHSGLLDPLTDVVLAEGLRRCRRWADAGRSLNVAVNLAPRTLTDPGFPDRVKGLLDIHGVDPGQLTLEISEAGVTIDTDRSMLTLRRLHEIGVRMSVDDFGTGYSSLSYLRRLPVQEIKLDRSFIQGMATDPGDLAIVRAAVDLSRHFGLTVVADGVESELTLTLLEEIGCDIGQGFLFSRPLPVERLEAWFAAQTEPEPTPQGEVHRLRAIR
jgi:diguanylate cyclase (GGDEF)-like protein